MHCRHCQHVLQQQFLDLGSAPPSNAYLSADDLLKPELRFPLRLWVCDECKLVQTEDYSRADELFNRDYAYFSSVSSTWLAHAAKYAAMITQRLGLNASSCVVEVAANDGYLLKNFVASGIPCLGIEPTDSTAAAAEALGINIRRVFFGEQIAKELADEGYSADLLIGNNVYAHVPDINDFTRGIARLLKPDGTVTLEFPHILNLIAENQFDTVYHEHFSYLSLLTVQRIFDAAGLRIYDVEKLPTHGGSLRIYGCLAAASHQKNASVDALLQEEYAAGLDTRVPYRAFQQQADGVRDALLAFLHEQQAAGKTVMAYGAAAKGNTLLNYAGVDSSLIPAVFDAAPSKQGMYMPGSRIPILAPAMIKQHKPDWLLILPWNIAPEVMEQQACIREWGGQFVVAVPSLSVLA